MTQIKADDFVQLADGTYVRRTAITRFQITTASDASWNTSASESETGEAVVNVMLSDTAQKEWMTAHVAKSKENAMDWLEFNGLL